MILVAEDEFHELWEDDKGNKYFIKKSSIDFNDWSFLRKKKFDRIDRNKQLVLKSKQYNWLGKDKARSLRANIKTKDLRRWGYEA